MTLGISGIPNFTVNLEKIKVAYYMPDSHLVMGNRSTASLNKKLIHKYSYTYGSNYLVHVESAYYGKFGVVQPDYLYQFNLEVPADRFVKNARVSAEEMKGYLTWTPLNSAYDSNYLELEPRKGYVGLKAGELHIIDIINENEVVAAANLFFHDKASDSIVRIFGEIRIEAKTRGQQQSEDAGLKRSLYWDADRVNDEYWTPEEYRRMIDFYSK